MEKIAIEATTKTPSVLMDPVNGNMELIGRSIPENSYQFYEPLLEWLDKYSLTPKESTTFTFKLDYFNTSSSMYILGILKKLEQLYSTGNQVFVKWLYDPEDEDMHQTGEDFKQIVKLPIAMQESED